MTSPRDSGDQLVTDIEIRETGPETYEVTVAARSTSQHSVQLSHAYYLQLTGGQVSEQALIEQSFRFLLEREPNTSILRRFDLPVIGDYFPEYESAIQERLGLTSRAEGDPT
jgi:hypothetical protein